MPSDKCWKKYYSSIIYFSAPYVFRNNNEKEKHISWNCVLLKTHFKSSRQLHIKVQLLTLHKLWPSAGGRLLLNVQMKKTLEGINQMASIFMINKWSALHIIIFLQLKAALCNEILSEMVRSCPTGKKTVLLTIPDLSYLSAIVWFVTSMRTTNYLGR